MNAFEAAAAAIQADPHLSVPATWRAAGTGPAVAIRIVEWTDARDPAYRAAAQARYADVRRIEAAAVRGDTLTFRPGSATAEATFRIEAVEPAEGGVLRCTLGATST